MEALDFLGDDGEAIVLLVAGCVALSLILLAVALFSARSGSAQARRFEAVRQRASGRRASSGPIAIKRGEATGALGGIERSVGRWLPRKAALQARLMRTGKKLTIAHYVIGIVLVAVLCTAIGIFAFRLKPLVAGFGGIALGLMLPHVFVGFLGARRVQKFTQSFPEAIDLIVRGLRSGLPISESIVTVSKEIADPIGAEFRTIDQSIRLGRTMEEALWDTTQRIDTPEFKFFVISVAVQRETGGNLAETLDNLADILRRRRQMKLKVKALSSEARASAYIIGSLPFLMFGILMLVSSAYVLELFYDRRGLVMVAAGLFSILIGALIMAKMVRFEI
ncbi:MAG TPA: type II secretion system F family protein [Alphaproteobacteria bacterium]|nr:type II secretion system F family protein [Alphaproteobacteria bacterium]